MKRCFLFLCFILFVHPAFAQHMDHGMPESGPAAIRADAGMKDMQMRGMLGPYSMNREASGTSWQPDSTPLSGIHFMKDDWMLMLHGTVNGIYDDQGGGRGDEKLFSTSMLMFMAQREAGPGTFGFKSMVSLDPAMGKRGYPLLLQTGETGDGQNPLIDRQHPHDFFMELAVSYGLSLSKDSSLYVYFGMPGEPALGPPAFMHRFSGMDNPEAPLSHHWLDSTHIVFGVGTIGYAWRNMKLEGSVFTGREPDESRWNFDDPEFDSQSVRLSFNPAENWALQISYGHLNSPEQLHPDVDTDRYTASASYNRPLANGNWQTTLAWGRNNNNPGDTLDAILLESAIAFHPHTFFGRAERLEKNELFPEGHPYEDRVFDVGKLSLGYIHDFNILRSLKFGVGGLASVHFVPDDLEPEYGQMPFSYMIFMRVKL